MRINLLKAGGNSLVEFVLVVPTLFVLFGVVWSVGLMGLEKIRLYHHAGVCLLQLKRGETPAYPRGTYGVVRTQFLSDKRRADPWRQDRSIEYLTLVLTKPITPPLFLRRLSDGAGRFEIQARVSGVRVRYEN